MRAKKFKTRMLTSIGFSNSFAFDLELFANSLDGKRVIFSFDSKGSLDKFVRELISLMDRTGCWNEIDSINGIIENR